MNYFARVDSEEIFYKEFARVIERLKEAGHEVILVGDIPTYDIHPQNCLYGSNAARAKARCSMKREVFDIQKQVFDDVLSRLSIIENIQYIPVDEPLCNELSCSMFKGQTILYRDEDHLNIPGSILIGSYLSNIISSNAVSAEP